ncbi:adenylate/guanylate cyclase domain-containing protein [Flagellimonas iocasae]|uniref:Adenylate/guanylate cyclase domain-containing protein n=1 Tax=Flagellimonas iocasae TaxID=2055905 RepID=A0ABW4Y4V3_9FLAO
MSGPETKRTLYRILPFGIIWLLSGWIFLIVEHAASDHFSHLPETAIKMDPTIFLLSSIAITVVGLLIGLIEIKYLSRLFSHKRFVTKIFYKLIIYVLLFFLIGLLTFPFAASLELDSSVLDSRVWEKYTDYFTSLSHFSTIVQLGTALVVSLFYVEIRDYLGQGVLKNFFTGKYHKPIEEERIFMFLDMKSSTTIAEKLGHVAYFDLLQNYYADISEPIVRYEGEIYQYAGDEIILSWKNSTPTANNRCIHCFFDMKKALQQKEAWYQKTFGLAPVFKAGIHLGKVTAGEIGKIKKEILFTGDPLNVAARIQSLCNSYQVTLLVSSNLVHQMELGSDFEILQVDKAHLRGKEASTELFTISEKELSTL